MFHARQAWLLTICLLAPVPSPAQTDMPGHPPGHVMETRDERPPEQLPPPVRMTGIGNAHMPVTATPEAQIWFDQGLNLLHDYWDYESARAFEQSLRVDPRCAMCYWGLYKAESFYRGGGQAYSAQALAKAVSLKSHATKRERLYIEAAAIHEEALKSARPGPLFARETGLWRRLVKEYPKDTQARIFLSQAVPSRETVAVLQAVLKDHPEDSAANHYLIHAVEAGDHPEQALHSAEILASLAPASGHMVHMPGHIFFLLGDYTRAEQAFAASLRVDEGYLREQHVDPADDWNYVHNLMYAIANLMEEGKLIEASALSAKLTGARGGSEAALYVASPRDSISRLNPKLPVALRTADWAQAIELLQAAQPTSAEPNLAFLARELTRFADGMKAFDAHDIARAEDFSRQLDAGLWRASQAAKDADNPGKTGGPDAALEPLLGTLSIMSLELRASIASARGNMADAKNLFTSAAREEKALGYREPPGYIRPVGETEGAAMLSAGAWIDAKAAYERALVERPHSGFALYGIAFALEKSGDSTAAAKAYAEFLAAWKNADPALPQLAHARACLAR